VGDRAQESLWRLAQQCKGQVKHDNEILLDLGNAS
jgi:hypothetical protein